jgi:hypothetical protein
VYTCVYIGDYSYVYKYLCLYRVSKKGNILVYLNIFLTFSGACASSNPAPVYKQCKHVSYVLLPPSSNVCHV